MCSEVERSVWRNVIGPGVWRGEDASEVAVDGGLFLWGEVSQERADKAAHHRGSNVVRVTLNHETVVETAVFVKAEGANFVG